MYGVFGPLLDCARDGRATLSSIRPNLRLRTRTERRTSPWQPRPREWYSVDIGRSLHRPGWRAPPLGAGSCLLDVFSANRDRARERLRKLNLVMLAVAIGVNDGPSAAFGQHAALGLYGMLEGDDAQFRNAAALFSEE